jgi:hypothetical protein
MRSEEGAYFGCRTIRIVTETLFEWLELGPMLRKERAKASERLRRKAQKAKRKMADFMRRVMAGARPIFKHRQGGKSVLQMLSRMQRYPPTLHRVFLR